MTTAPILDIAAIPLALRKLNQWVLWRYVPDDEDPTKLRKVPYTDVGKKAKPNDRRTWLTFEAALTCCQANPAGWAGIGFVFSADDPYVGIDIDSCLDAGGNVEPWAQSILDRVMSTYAEISPSGNGIKVWVDAPGTFTLGSSDKAAGQIEVYSSGRFFAVTGQAIEGAPASIADVPAETIEIIIAEEQARRKAHKPARQTVNGTRPTTNGTHATLGLPGLTKLLDGLGEDRWSSYDDWLRIGMALHDWAQGDTQRLQAAYGLFDLYSKERAPDAYGETTEKWESFGKRSDDTARVTVGTLIHWLNEDAADTTNTTADDSNDGRPAIDRTTMDLPALTAKAWDAVIKTNGPPTLFRRNSELVRLETTDDGARKLAAVDTRRMMGILARAARWYRVTVTRQGTYETDTTPPAAVVDDCMVNIDERMPAIARIVQTPTIGPSGELFLSPGYHEAGRLFYDPPLGVTVPTVPEKPTAADVAKAKALILDELLVDFPFVSDADRAHAVALFLLPFVREYINGPTPLHLVEAPTMGSGKGLLAETLLYPALGATPSPMAEAGDDDEWRKRITSALLSGPAAIYIDNLNKMLASGALALALTARDYTDRVLGSSDQIRLPVRCVWVAAANNPALSTEISRRCIRIRIDPRTDKPWQREGFKHPKLRAWVKEQHGNLIYSALVLCKHGLTHGQPGQSLGSYEAWSEVMGRILQAAGIPGFLGNLDALYDRADAEGAAWRALISAWWEKHQSTPQPSSELYSLVSDAGADDLISGKDDTGRKKSFGKALARVVDRVFSIEMGGETRRLQLAEDGVRHKAKLWRLVPVEVGGLGGFSAPTHETNNSSRNGVRKNTQNTQNPPAQMPPKSARYLDLASRYAAATGEVLSDGIWQENELDELEQHVVAYERRVSVHTPGPHDRLIDPEGWLTYENTDTAFSEFADVPIDEEEP